MISSPASTIAAPGARSAAIFDQHHRQQSVRRPRGVHADRAGAFKTRELQYYAAGYRQVLTGEGLTYFANASYGFGRPGTEELEILEYQTRSFYAETGLSYPVIRSRERNLNVTGLWFASNDRGIFFDLPDEPPSTHDRMRGVRVRVDADFADRVGGINQLYVVFSQGIAGSAPPQNGQYLASRANGRVDFTKIELTLSRLQPLPLPAFSALVAAYGQYAMTPLLVSELCGYGGRLFGRAFDPSQFVSDSCLRSRWSSCATTFPFNFRRLPRPSSTASSTTAGSTILPRFRAHLPAWMQPPSAAGYAWDGSML